MADGIIMGYIVGPALVIGAYDTCVVTVDDNTTVSKIAVYEDIDCHF